MDRDELGRDRTCYISCYQCNFPLRSTRKTFTLIRKKSQFVLSLHYTNVFCSRTRWYRKWHYNPHTLSYAKSHRYISVHSNKRILLMCPFKWVGCIGLVSTNIFTVDSRLHLIADCRQSTTFNSRLSTDVDTVLHQIY